MFLRQLRDIHWPILMISLILMMVGVIAIYSASFRAGGDFAMKQMVWASIGIGVFFITVWVGYRPILSSSHILYVLALILLVVVLTLGEARSGAHRWIDIGPFALQPSELAKVATAMTLANFLAERSSATNQKRTLLFSGIIVLVPFFLILKQPDLGSGLVFIPAFVAVLFFWGVRIRYYVILFIAGVIAMPFAWHFLKPYQQKRILVFLNPSIDPIGASYTAIQSKIAVGSGGLIGKGWLHGTQNQLDFVPEHHTDFIFSVIGEEFGFLGSILIIFLFITLIGYGFQIVRHTTDQRARLLAIGIIAMISFQVFINIGMTIGVAPITGITLPFISYGGASLIMTFFAIGLLASIYKERSIF